MKYFYLTVVTLACLALPAQKGFIRYYPTTYDKTSREILPTPDGGYIIAGSTNNSNPIDCDVYVMKTNGDGDLVKEKSYGGAKPDYPYSMVATDDGNYLIAGFSQSYSGGDYDIYVLKIDQDLNELGHWTYGSWGNEEAREIIKTADGNYAIVGSSTSSVSSQQMILLRIDKNGNQIGQARYYGGSATEFGNSVQQCSDGGFIVLGQTFSWGADGDVYLVRTNANGDEMWTKYFGNALAEEGIGVVADDDGGFTFVVRDSTANADVDVRVMKTDGNGNVTIDKSYGGSLKDTPKRIRKATDGGYIVGAISRSFEPPSPDPSPDVWLMKLTSALDLSWTKLYGLAAHEHCHDVKPFDEGYIFVGHTASYPEPGRKIYFVKTDGSGDVVVSVDQQILANGFNAFPNPVSDGVLNIRCGTLEAVITLCDVNGRQVYQGSTHGLTEGQTKMVDLNGQTTGIYILSFETEQGKMSKKVLIH